MKIIALQHPQMHEFLLRVMETYTRGGLPAAELPIAADVYIALTNAREIQTEQHIGHAKVTGLGPNGIALEVESGLPDVHPPRTVPESSIDPR
jgi:hypothetical protein